MHTLFEKISRLSWPMVIFIASFFTLAAVLPLSIYLTRRETNIVSRAVNQTSLAPTVKPTPVTGPVPASPPVITRVYPWVGKQDDAIIIEGTNFGVYPINRRLAIAGVLIPDASVTEWTDTRIETIIPQNPQQHQPVTLRIDTYPITESIPLVFYDEKTKARLTKQGSQITLIGGDGTVKAVLITSSGTRETTVTGTGQTAVPLFTLSPSEEIQSLLLTDGKGIPISYSINPTEFGF